MAKKFVEPEEAAQMLGVTTEQLGEMRDRREVYPIRDGGVWKYRVDDIERLVAERAGGGFDELADELMPEENQESILLSEATLGESGGASSTVIGKLGEGGAESDLKLASGSSSAIDLGASDIKPGSGKPGSSKFGMPSDVRLASESDLAKAGSGLSTKFDELDALDLDLPSATESGITLAKPSGGSSKKFKDAEELSIADEDLSLGSESSIKGGSSRKLSGSGVNVGDDDDDDFVLGGSGKGSDITHRAGDSGIQLISPADSGLSLEEAPLGIGGSGIESLDLGDDDMLLVEGGSSNESATQLKSDDDFLLTPLEEAGGDESDSGSQVIALDSEVEFDEAASTMLGSRQPAMAAMLEEDMGDSGLSPLLSADAGFGGHSALGATSAFMAAPQVVEAPFSLWNILGLTFCTVLLMLCGMMLYDLMRTMWSWDAPYQVNSSLMDALTGMF
jgi:hypothetical protein